MGIGLRSEDVIVRRALLVRAITDADPRGPDPIGGTPAPNGRVFRLCRMITGRSMNEGSVSCCRNTCATEISAHASGLDSEEGNIYPLPALG